MGSWSRDIVEGGDHKSVAPDRGKSYLIEGDHVVMTLVQDLVRR